MISFKTQKMQLICSLVESSMSQNYTANLQKINHFR